MCLVPLPLQHCIAAFEVATHAYHLIVNETESENGIDKTAIQIAELLYASYCRAVGITNHHQY